jgi:hypothetical protein
MTDPNGERIIIDTALNLSLLNNSTKQISHPCLLHFTFDNRLKLACQLEETFPNPRKLTNIFLNFINQNKAQMTSTLRSNGILSLIRWEHRILDVGADITFTIIIEDDVRRGGSCEVRLIAIGSDYCALKSLKLQVAGVYFEKEVSIFKRWRDDHVSIVFASMKDQSGRYHLILSPWCDATLLTKVI